VFYFIEERRDRCEHLVQVVQSMQLPRHVKVLVEQGTFADSFGRALTAIEEAQQSMAPALVMVDPFGVKGLPMTMMKRIAAQDRSEVLVSFMYESMSRFLDATEFESHLDELFGTELWRDALTKSGSNRRSFLLDLYQQQLTSAGFTYITAFQLLDKANRTEYYLIHATKSKDGLSAIKAAMWKADPTGTFQFSDATAGRGQLPLVDSGPFDALQAELLKRFAARRSVPMQELIEWVLEFTRFRETHLKQQALRPLEKAKKVRVIRPTGHRSSYWGDDVVVDFP
jgi:three-Cys-motif partner protein